MADYGLALDALIRQMNEIQIMDSMRSSHRLPMPSVENSHRFDVAATKMSSCVRTTYDGRNREMTSFFGCPPLVLLLLLRTFASQQQQQQQLVYYSIII